MARMPWQGVLNKQLKRNQVLSFFANLPPCVIGMEACAVAHHWARKRVIRASGEADGSEVREVLRQDQQERCGGCRGDLRSPAPTEYALHTDQER